MPTYAVTGKLGSGKTLACVGRIRDALHQGRPIATNLDLNLDKLVGKKAKNVRVYRLPDRPTADDLYALGSGNTGYDEEMNGLLVLDECGTWFNAREWNDKNRRGIVDWLLFARKLGWDPYFLVQEVTLIDKQVRKSLLEMVVYCRRLDRLTVPLLDPIYKAFVGKPIPKKKLHVGFVRFGEQPHAPLVERWWYQGSDLYQAYDTKQVFQENYEHGVYTMLPPWYTHGRYMRPRDWRFVMRLTKIHLKRYSRVLLMAVAATGGAAVTAAVTGSGSAEKERQELTVDDLRSMPGVEVKERQEENQDQVPEAGSARNVAKAEPRQEDPLAKWRGAELTGVAANAEGEPIYAQVRTKQGTSYSLDGIRAAGFNVSMPDKCKLIISDQDTGEMLSLHTAYCSELG